MSVRRRTWRNPKTGAQEEKWMVDIKFQHPDGRRERVRMNSPVQTRRGAEQYERDVRQRLLDGTFGKEEDEAREAAPTFKEFAEEFLATYAKVNNKPSEHAAKEWMLRLHLSPAFGSRRLDDISSRDIQGYKAKKLREGLAAKTLNNQLACLGKMLKTAQAWRLIEHAPAVQLVKAPKPRFDFLDFEEADRLADASEGQLKAMIVVALNTGLRIGEMRALRWDDIDLVAGRLVVRRSVYRDKIGTPKGGREREVPLNAKALAALKVHRHLRGPLVFSTSGGAMLSETETYPPLSQAARAAGLGRNVTWHVLRHTFASHLTMKGVPPKAVQELMGHASLEMTMRYSHLTPDVRKDAVKALEGHNRGTTEVAEQKS